jgi:hypothetical protein
MLHLNQQVGGVSMTLMPNKKYQTIPKKKRMKYNYAIQHFQHLFQEVQLHTTLHMERVLLLLLVGEL